MEFRNFNEYLEKMHREGKYRTYTERILQEGKVKVRAALEIARKEKVRPDLIERVERRAMLDGSIEMTYEGAERIYSEMKAGLQKRANEQNCNWAEVIESLDPVKDHVVIANLHFVLNPEVRKRVANKIESLYRVVLNYGAGKKKGYQTNTRNIRLAEKGRSLLDLERITSILPADALDKDEEEWRRLRIILDKKAERDSFILFKDNPGKAFEYLEKKIAETGNENLKGAYKRLIDKYHAYIGFNVEAANPDFQDPETGEKGIFPSLHQKIALYHIQAERRFGVFDGCGTGKTAIGALAQPLIEKKLQEQGKEFRRTVVVGPNKMKKAWETGLAGEKNERYFAEPQDVFVINGEKKDDEFMKNLREKKWIVVNFEQLTSRVNGSEKILAQVLAEMGIDYLIIDESHHIKEMRTQTPKGKPTLSAATRFLALNAPYLVLLSGSPIPDRPKDYAVPFSLLNPELCSDPKMFDEIYEENPRILYTLFLEKTVRRTSEDVNDALKVEFKDIGVPLTNAQRKIFDHINEFKPQNWLIEMRKVLLDPRLVKPEILKRAGVLGKVGIGDSAKYKKLEELITAKRGPLARGDRFVVFSSMFREGVTQAEHEDLREQYGQMGIPEEYERLQLNRSLDALLSESLQRRYGREMKIGVLDGTVDFEERERIVDGLKGDLAGIIATTETGGESMNFTAANWAFFLDRDYTPTTEEQAIARVLRKGQKKKVFVRYIDAENTIDEILIEYLQNKKKVISIATDGVKLTEGETEILYDNDCSLLKDMIKRGLGGKSIDVHEAVIDDIESFSVVRRGRGAGGIHSPSAIQYDTTEAQELMRWIGRDVNCWKDPAFVELYMKTLPNLAVPVVHRAKICDLVQRAQNGEITFPKKVISEGSGPSLLYDAYKSLEDVVKKSGFGIPLIYDRDFSPVMLEKGKNPNKILGDMTGKNSTVQDGEFDMVDNESISLLRNPDEVKSCLLEANRILRPDGLMELIVKNMRFIEQFYTGLEKIGFEVLSQKNEGFAVSKAFRKELHGALGEHYADSYANKLASTYLIIARKKDKPQDTVSADKFWFEPLHAEAMQASIGKKEKSGESNINSSSKAFSPEIDKIAKEIERGSKGRAKPKGRKIVRMLPDDIPGLTKRDKRITGEA